MTKSLKEIIEKVERARKEIGLSKEDFLKLCEKLGDVIE
jgi:hypothetical protein